MKKPKKPMLSIKFPADAFGPVKDPTDNDVLSGRGGAVNSHQGNQRYRVLVNSFKAEYLSPNTRKKEKTQIAAQIVMAIRKSNGRFLKVDESTGLWHEIGDKAAVRKTGQCLREGSSVFRSCWDEMLAGRRDEGISYAEKNTAV